MSYEARIFELRDAEGASIRTVACMDDGGRWTFETSGHASPIESTFPYDAKRKSARFTFQHLCALVRECGLAVPDATDFQNAGRYVLYEIARAFPGRVVHNRRSR